MNYSFCFLCAVYMLLFSCTYSVLTLKGFNVVAEVINRTTEQGVDVLLRRKLEHHLSRVVYGGDETIVVKVYINSIRSSTEIALEGTPLRSLRVVSTALLMDECGRNIFKKSFDTSWVFPAESSIEETEVQSYRTLEIVVDRLAEIIVRWLAVLASSGMIKQGEFSGECKR